MRLEFKVSPAVENMDLTGTLDAEVVQQSLARRWSVWQNDVRLFQNTKAFRLSRPNQVKFDIRTHDESETTLQGYRPTVGCSRLLLNLVIAGALQCMNFDSFYGTP